MFDKIMKNDKLFIALGVIFIAILAMAPNKAEALEDSFCNSNKCKARVERLNECVKEGSTNVVQCATNKTLKALEPSINNELDSLYQLAIKQPSKDVKTYKKELYKFVREGEGEFQSKAFCDSYYKTKKGLIRHPGYLCEKWTIGFGTNSYNGEVITYNEAIKRKQKAIDIRDDSIKTTCLSDEVRIVAVDFIYQYTSYYANKMRGFANSCDEKAIKDYIVAHRNFYRKKEQWGLVKREQKRINYAFNN